MIFNTTDSCLQIYLGYWENIWCTPMGCEYPTILTHPIDKSDIAVGSNATFSVEATGSKLYYKWQESTDGGTVWKMLSDGGTHPNYSGTHTNTLVLMNIPAHYHEYKYRCHVSNACGFELSAAATLSHSCGQYVNITFTYNGSEVTYGTVERLGKCWLDRNLGATQVATSSTDAASYGDLFQWGRLVDGHQIRTSGTTSTLSNLDNPGHGSFITISSGNYDWRSPQNNNLWQGVSGTNNPCPAGFRLPTEAEWDAERLSWGGNNAGGAFGSTLKLPAAGFRTNTGSLSGVGTNGNYWSSTVGGTASRSLYFSSSLGYMSTIQRAYGRSVRCIKD